MSDETNDPVAAATPSHRPAEATPTDVYPGQHGLPPDLSTLFDPPQAADELGRLGGYRVLRQLGQGGMGVVFEAEEVALARRVALKLMRPHIALSEDARRRFVREAQTAAATEDDHIVPIFGVGEVRGVPFLAMPLLPGESLAVRLARERQLPVADLMRVGRDMATGLAAAHAAGLVHRDIKPANLWLEGRGAGEPFRRLRILDFGLARPQEPDGLTTTGALLGTPAYMSPEQIDGRPLDGRSDLFSLGCVLYRAATGRPPFDGPTVTAVLRSVAEHRPPEPKKLRPELPADLSDLIVRLLEKSPERRPASAADVVEALRAVRTIVPKPSPRLMPLPTAALVIAAGLGLGYVAWRQLGRPEVARPATLVAPEWEAARAEMRTIAQAVATVALANGIEAICIGEFTGPEGTTEVTAVTAALLAGELKAAGLAVEPVAKTTISGKYAALRPSQTGRIYSRLEVAVGDGERTLVALNRDVPIHDRFASAFDSGAVPAEAIHVDATPANGAVIAITPPNAGASTPLALLVDDEDLADIAVKKPGVLNLWVVVAGRGVKRRVQSQNDTLILPFQRGDVFRVFIENESDHDLAITLRVDGLDPSNRGVKPSQFLVKRSKRVSIPGWYVRDDSFEEFEIVGADQGALRAILSRTPQLNGKPGTVEVTWAEARPGGTEKLPGDGDLVLPDLVDMTYDNAELVPPHYRVAPVGGTALFRYSDAGIAVGRGQGFTAGEPFRNPR